MSAEDHGIPIDFKSSRKKTNEILPDISELMIRTENGGPKALLANAITVLRYDPAWWDVLAFNEFSLHTVTKKPAPWQSTAGANWTDNDDSLTANWMHHAGILVSSKTAAEAVQVVAREKPFHPVRDYLHGLSWDQQPRLDSWLITYLGAPDTPFNRAIGPRWLISAVARIERPGCQADYTLLIEGPQGALKSSALRVLASDEWFADHISDLGSKDSRIELHGKWILEHAELDRIRRGELERVKSFLTARTDHFRVPYGRRANDVPRSCVFAATVNDQTPFTDETGNRRFWPVRCGTIDIKRLTADRDQLWAEAYQRYCGGAKWFLDTQELNELAKAEQDERYDSDIWQDTILEWTDNPQPRQGSACTAIESTIGCVSISEILSHALGMDMNRCSQTDKNRVGRCLVHEGWKRKQIRCGPLRKWFYVKAGP